MQSLTPLETCDQIPLRTLLKESQTPIRLHFINLKNYEPWPRRKRNAIQRSGQDAVSPKEGGQQVITVARLAGPDNFC